MTVLMVFFVHHGEYVLSPEPRRDTYLLLFYVHHYLMGMWMLCVVLLGMGGLIRERAVGASSFTLALPVSRERLVGVQIAVGIFQAIGLAALPWSAILLTTGLNGRPFAVWQAAFYFLLLISGGLTYFAMAVLISSLIEGEYTAPAVAYGLVILSGIVFANVGWLRPFADLWRYMGGDNHFNKSTYLLSGPFPWLGALASLSVAALLLVASVGIIQRREF
jgi:ABC-type transport system involved in multi-copper enzyme maturation permease subunit